MRIGLIDVDSHNFPNLALMKISAFHKNRGDDVEFWNGFFYYDVVYKSKVFTDLYSHDDDFCLMDSNITASKECEKHFDDLIKSGARINFEGGLDIRFMTEKKCDQLNRMNVSMLHFAWDNYEFDTYEKLKKFRPMLSIDKRRLTVYVLTNFDTTIEQDLERIYKLKELGCTPYVMIFDKPNASKELLRLQRWCNNRFIFRAVDRFEDYKKERKDDDQTACI